MPEPAAVGGEVGAIRAGTWPVASPRKLMWIGVAAVAFAFALVLLPGPRRAPVEVAAAAALALVVVGLAALSRSAPLAARLGMPLVYVAFVAVLVDSGGGTSSGWGGLLLLPLLWLAVSGSRRELLLGFVAVLAARVIPVLVVGAPEYPSSSWRTALVLAAVAAIACFTIQRLVGDARVRTAELLSRASELEQATHKLAAQNEDLRELDRLKDEFVALVSHELRTPLTSITGYLEMLVEDERDALSPSQQRFVATASRNAQRLTTLVNDLLFLVQLDSGRIDLNRVETDLNELLLEAAEAATPAATGKQIELRLRADQLEPTVCDRTRIAQLIDNLVTNAIKFTPNGGRVEITAKQEADTIAISVSDTGIGIPADELALLFDRFYRASTATKNMIPGTGLGLTISRAIAEAHNGRITVQSTPARGTTFQLLLPAKRPALARRSTGSSRNHALVGRSEQHKTSRA